MTNKRAIAKLSELAKQASHGLETCSQCTLGACCTNNRTLIVHEQEIVDRKHLFTDEVIAKTKKEIENYKTTGFFTCPFFDEENKLCSIYEERFLNCAAFLVLSEPEQCLKIDGNRAVLSHVDKAFSEVKHKEMLTELRRIQKTPRVNFIEVIEKAEVLK